MTKSRIALIALAIGCIAMLGAGTAAYFTVQDTAHNVITTGLLEMELVEKTTEGKAPEVAPDDYESLPDFPVNEDGTPGVFNVMPGQTVSKIPYVKMGALGTADFYTRMQLTTTITAEDGSELPLVNAEGVKVITLDISESWTEQDGWYYYNQAVTREDDVTEPLFTGVTFAPEMGNEYQNATVTILVDAQAVQSKNNGESALTAAGWPVTDTEAE